jgi:hypothetical protein
MSTLNSLELFIAHCGAIKRWGMVIRFTPPQANEWNEFRLACSYYNELSVQHMCDGEAFLFFDTEAEMRSYYERTVGEDGPTATNPYKGPFRVWAMTCGPDGRAWD